VKAFERFKMSRENLPLAEQDFDVLPNIDLMIQPCDDYVPVTAEDVSKFHADNLHKMYLKKTEEQFQEMMEFEGDVEETKEAVKKQQVQIDGMQSMMMMMSQQLTTLSAQLTTITKKLEEDQMTTKQQPILPATLLMSGGGTRK